MSLFRAFWFKKRICIAPFDNNLMIITLISMTNHASKRIKRVYVVFL